MLPPTGCNMYCKLPLLGVQWHKKPKAIQQTIEIIMRFSLCVYPELIYLL